MVAAAAKFGRKHQMEVKAALEEEAPNAERRSMLKNAIFAVSVSLSLTRLRSSPTPLSLRPENNAFRYPSFPAAGSHYHPNTHTPKHLFVVQEGASPVFQQTFLLFKTGLLQSFNDSHLSTILRSPQVPSYVTLCDAGCCVDAGCLRHGC